jgi:hypothetical protein
MTASILIDLVGEGVILSKGRKKDEQPPETEGYNLQHKRVHTGGLIGRDGCDATAGLSKLGLVRQMPDCGTGRANGRRVANC